MAMVNYANKYIAFLIIVIIYILMNFQIISFVSLTDVLMVDLNVNTSQLGLLSGLCFLFCAIIQPFTGYLTDKYGAKPILLLSFLGVLCSSALFSLSNDFISALLSRSLMGLFIGGTFIPLLKLIAEYFDGSKYSQMLGLYFGAGGTIGTLLATVGIPIIKDVINWKLIFIIFSLLGLIVYYFLNTRIKNNLETKESSACSKFSRLKEAKNIALSREVLIIQLIFFICFGVYVSFQGLWIISYLETHNVSSMHLINIALITMSLGYFSGSFLGSYLTNKVFHCRVIPLRLSLMMLIISWGFITVIPSVLNIFMLSILLGVIGISVGIISPVLFSVITDIIPPESHGIAFGIVNPSALLGTFVFQILTGMILEHFNNGTIYSTDSFLIMMIFCFISLIVITFISLFLRETMSTQQNESPVSLFTNIKLAKTSIKLLTKIKVLQNQGKMHVKPIKTKFR
ncbi:MAG: MFS transporter [Cyanobacteriota bacterium]